MGVIADGAAYILGKAMVAVADTNGNLRRIGNTTDFTTNVDFETLEIYSNETATKTLDKEFKIATNPGFAFTIQETGIPENLALGLSGAYTDVVQPSGTDQAVPAGLTTKKGSFLYLGSRKITSISTTGILSGKSATTDYVLYGQQGYLFIPYDSTIADDSTLDETITYDAVNYKTVSMYSADTVEREVHVISAISPYPVLQLWRCTIKPAGDLAWISDEPMVVPIEGKILDDSTNHAVPNHFGKLFINEIV